MIPQLNDRCEASITRLMEESGKAGKPQPVDAAAVTRIA